MSNENTQPHHQWRIDPTKKTGHRKRMMENNKERPRIRGLAGSSYTYDLGIALIMP
jgi:hypothetical protein